MEQPSRLVSLMASMLLRRWRERNREKKLQNHRIREKFSDYKPLHDQLERWSGLDDGVLCVLVAQVVQVCDVDLHDGVARLESSLVGDASCINLQRKTRSQLASSPLQLIHVFASRETRRALGTITVSMSHTIASRLSDADIIYGEINISN